MGAAFSLSFSYEHACTCGTCNVPIIMEAAMLKKRLEDGKSFFCINGHPTHFGETVVARMERELAREKQAKEWAERRRASEEKSHKATRGQLTKAKNQLGRVACGVCPLCKRNFGALREHMKTKHPEYRFDTGVPLLPAKGETS